MSRIDSDRQRVLSRWLKSRNAECVWSKPVQGGYVERYRFPGGGTALVTVASGGLGFEIYTSDGGNDTAASFADAETRMGLKPL